MLSVGGAAIVGAAPPPVLGLISEECGGADGSRSGAGSAIVDECATPRRRRRRVQLRLAEEGRGGRDGLRSSLVGPRARPATSYSRSPLHARWAYTPAELT